MTSGFATVKGVTSGDTLLLVGRAAAGPPPELQLTLSGVAAPRLAKGSNAVDEPFAWAARDFLRRLALGKAVSFRVDGEAAGRSFGAAWLKTGAMNDNVAAFVHRTRCNSKLTATTVMSPGNKPYKYCKNVGDAFYSVLSTAPGNVTSWAACKAACDANPDCAACQTDGLHCKLLETYTKDSCGDPVGTDPPAGCDAWFKVF